MLRYTSTERCHDAKFLRRPRNTHRRVFQGEQVKQLPGESVLTSDSVEQRSLPRLLFTRSRERVRRVNGSASCFSFPCSKTGHRRNTTKASPAPRSKNFCVGPGSPYAQQQQNTSLHANSLNARSESKCSLAAAFSACFIALRNKD